ncbi:MAG: SocA family protein [Rickettsiales bacterium]|jgi:uncharacterized phage-associated protein|nr:SocA family protein [Rickettsiales bacterium]
MSIRFNTNTRKALEAIIYLANKKADMTQYYFMKMIFFAEKYHINKYGIPIIGDRYIKMDNGPVPSFVLDAIRLDGAKLTHDIYEEINKSLDFRKDSKKIHTSAKRKPDLSFLSSTNLECLDKAFNLCKAKSFDELKNLTHEETAWKKAVRNRDMDYALFVDDNHPDKEIIVADLSDNFGTLVL